MRLCRALLSVLRPSRVPSRVSTMQLRSARCTSAAREKSQEQHVSAHPSAISSRQAKQKGRRSISRHRTPVQRTLPVQGHLCSCLVLLAPVTALRWPAFHTPRVPPGICHHLNRVHAGEGPPAPTLMHTQSDLLIMQIKYSNIITANTHSITTFPPRHFYPAPFQHKKGGGRRRVTNPSFITRNINYM